MLEQLYCEIIGPEFAPPAIALHGFMGDSTDWRVPLSRITCRRWYLLDLPGHGAATHLPHAYDYTITATIDRLRRLTDSFNGQKFDILGYSLGGRIALEFAATYPHRLHRLILESTNPGITQPQEQKQRLAHDTAKAHSLEQDGTLAFLAQWYKQPLFGSLLDNPEFQPIFQRRAQQSPHELAKVLRTMSIGNQPPRWDFLHSWDHQILYICGDNDQKYREIGKGLAKTNSNICTQIIAQASHCVHLDNPNAFSTAINDFLK